MNRANYWLKTVMFGRNLVKLIQVIYLCQKMPKIELNDVIFRDSSIFDQTKEEWKRKQEELGKTWECPYSWVKGLTRNTDTSRRVCTIIGYEDEGVVTVFVEMIDNLLYKDKEIREQGYALYDAIAENKISIEEANRLYAEGYTEREILDKLGIYTEEGFLCSDYENIDDFKEILTIGLLLHEIRHYLQYEILKIDTKNMVKDVDRYYLDTNYHHSIRIEQDAEFYALRMLEYMYEEEKVEEYKKLKIGNREKEYEEWKKAYEEDAIEMYFDGILKENLKITQKKKNKVVGIVEALENLYKGEDKKIQKGLSKIKDTNTLREWIVQEV